MSLPRSAVLAAWAQAVAAGRARVADAVAAVEADEEHAVARVEVDGQHLLAATGLTLPDPAFLPDVLVVLATAADRGPLGVRVALPAPGDTAGVPPARQLAGWACDAGECVVADGLLALVPEVATFGSDLDPGTAVTWHLWTLAPGPMGGAAAAAGPGAHASVAEADLAMRTVLADVTRALERLDVAAWRPAGGAVREAVTRAGHLPLLPPTLAPRARALLASAAEVLAIVDAAGADTGGAVTGHEVGRRADALAGAERAARRAIEAAVNLPG